MNSNEHPNNSILPHHLPRNLRPVAKPARRLVMLCKFKSLSLFISLEMIPYTVCKHRKICNCMTKCRAGFATAYTIFSIKTITFRWIALLLSIHYHLGSLVSFIILCPMIYHDHAYKILIVRYAREVMFMRTTLKPLSFLSSAQILFRYLS